MKGLLKRFMFVIVAVMMLGVFIPQNVEAKETYEYNIFPLKQNEWISTKGEQGGFRNGSYHRIYNLYKITIPANGYVTIELPKNERMVCIYKSTIKTKGAIGKYFLSPVFKEAKNYIVLPKGTFYLRVSGDTKLKWSFKKVSNPANYCKAKAKKNTKE